MSLVRNTPGQYLYAVLISRTDGAPITIGAQLNIAKDGAAASVAQATLTHRFGGLWEAALSQPDTNGAIIGYVWSGSNIVSQGGTIVTDEHARSAILDLQVSMTTLLTRISATIFLGITSLAEWLGLMAGKQEPDETALEEIRATGAGSGTYTPGTDSLEAIRDHGDEAWGEEVTTPTLDNPCAQNPARTRGPTTEPPLIPTPYSRTRVLLETTNNH
jgi:hypothetical protein